MLRPIRPGLRSGRGRTHLASDRSLKKRRLFRVGQILDQSPGNPIGGCYAALDLIDSAGPSRFARDLAFRFVDGSRIGFECFVHADLGSVRRLKPTHGSLDGKRQCPVDWLPD